MMNFGYSPYSYGFFGPIFMIIFWGVIILAIVFVARWIASQGGQGGDKTNQRNNSALDILKERYAKGEINKQEFEDKKRDLV